MSDIAAHSWRCRLRGRCPAAWRSQLTPAEGPHPYGTTPRARGDEVGTRSHGKSCTVWRGPCPHRRTTARFARSGDELPPGRTSAGGDWTLTVARSRAAGARFPCWHVYIALPTGLESRRLDR